jgi:hypothetical protein
LLLDCSNELVSATANRSHEARNFSVVVEGLAELVDRSVQAVVEIDECVGGPKAFTELVPLDHFAGAFEEDQGNLKGVVMELNFLPSLRSSDLAISAL